MTLIGRSLSKIAHDVSWAISFFMISFYRKNYKHYICYKNEHLN